MLTSWCFDRIVWIFLWLSRAYPFLTVKLDLKQSILSSQYDVDRALDPIDHIKSIPCQEYTFSSRSSWTLNIATQQLVALVYFFLYIYSL